VGQLDQPVRRGREALEVLEILEALKPLEALEIRPLRDYPAARLDLGRLLFLGRLSVLAGPQLLAGSPVPPVPAPRAPPKALLVPQNIQLA